MGTPHGVSARSTNETCDWVQAHAALSRLSVERAALDAEEGRWLLCAWRSAAHVHLGYGSFAQYVESLFGYKPRATQEKLRVAEALEALPRLAGALESGALSWCAVRELTRVALPSTESAWIDAARGKTLRELEALAASKAPGDTPDACQPANENAGLDAVASAGAEGVRTVFPPSQTAPSAPLTTRAQMAPAWARRARTPVRSPAPNKASHRRCVAPCSRGTNAAAACRAAPTRRSWTCTTSRNAQLDGATVELLLREALCRIRPRSR